MNNIAIKLLSLECSVKVFMLRVLIDTIVLIYAYLINVRLENIKTVLLVYRIEGNFGAAKIWRN